MDFKTHYIQQRASGSSWRAILTNGRVKRLTEASTYTREKGVTRRALGKRRRKGAPGISGEMVNRARGRGNS
jgi:hypothetical protein